MYQVLLVGAGGFLGSIFRYLISNLTQTFATGTILPIGTLIVNTLGCLLIGYLDGIAEVRQLFTPETRLVLFIGFLGGFTTFSTFGFETLQLMRDNQVLCALIYVVLQIIIGLGAVWLGFILAKHS